MPITVAQIVAKVVADTKQAEANIAAFGAKMQAASTSAAAVHGGALLALGGVAALGAVAGIAAHQAADFETELTQLVTGAGESNDALAKVRAGILAMATDTGTSTDQLTAGMYMIDSAGYTAAKGGLTVLKNAAEGAKVGAADLGTVANATTTLMTDFGIAAADSAVPVNALIATVSDGKTHMEDLASALAEIAPTASAAHVSMTDMLAAMATMTGEGIPAANSATYLRQMIIALNAPSDTAKKALEKLGLKSADVAAKMQVSMPAALKLITDALDKKFPQAAGAAERELAKVKAGTESMDQALQHIAAAGGADYVTALKDISGGVREMQGMLALTGDHLTKFGDNQQAINKAIQTGGKDITNWNMVQGTFNQKMSQAGAALQVVAINVGAALLPALSKLVGAITPLISKFGDFVTALTSNHDLMSKLAPVAQILAGVLGGVVVAALFSLSAAGWAALAPFLAFAAPFIAIGAAIAALVIGIKLLIDHWHQITATITGAVHPALLLVQGAVRDVQTGVSGLGNIVGAVKDKLVEWRGAIEITAGVLATVFGPALIQSGVAAVTAGAQIASSFVAQVVRSGVEAVVAGAKITAQFVTGLVKTGAQAAVAGARMVIAFIPSVIAATTSLITMATSAIVGAITGLIAYAAAGWAAAAATLAATWPILAIIAAVALLAVGIYELVTHWKQVTDFLGGVWHAIVLGVQLDIAGIILPFRILAWVLTNTVGGAWKGLQTIVSTVWGGIASTVRGGINFIIRGMNGLISGIDKIQFDVPGWVPVIGGQKWGFNIPKIPELATGGVIASAGMALVGERGPELVSLPRGASVLPNPQTRAAMNSLGQTARQTQQIIIQLDGRTIAQTTVKHMPHVIRLGTGARSF